MKFYLILILMICIMTGFSESVAGQCAMCTKTAQQLGEKPAQGLNSGILYLMFAPFAIVGFIGYRWWRNNKESEAQPG